MIYQIFSIILSALFLLFVFWALWYIAIPLFIIAVLFSAFGVFIQKIKLKSKTSPSGRRTIKPNDVIDVDFQEVK